MLLQLRPRCCWRLVEGGALPLLTPNTCGEELLLLPHVCRCRCQQVRQFRFAADASCAGVRCAAGG
jgi:hypothetical protein